MVNINPNSQPPLRSRSLAKPAPRLSLNLHTMPQTDNRHFKTWLFLGLLICVLLVVAALLIFWQ